MDNLICSFFGHRNVYANKELENSITILIEKLITEKNVTKFLFGSKSKFDSLCLKVVSDLKVKHPHIIRVGYNCKSECFTLEKNRELQEKLLNSATKQKLKILCVDEEVDNPKLWNAGKASYLERNQNMIDESDYCIFYYNENYKPQTRKKSKKSISEYQPNSGTALAYKYATRKRKNIINTYSPHNDN